MKLFILGWLCGWGAIVLAGVIAGLVLRANRSSPPKVRVRIETPNETISHVELRHSDWVRKEQKRILEECRRWREGELQS